jgi:WD40 repeat protein
MSDETALQPVLAECAVTTVSHAHEGRAVRAIFELSSAAIVTAGDDNTLQVVRPGTNGTPLILSDWKEDGRITAAAAIDSARVVAGSSDGRLHVWNVETASCEKAIRTSAKVDVDAIAVLGAAGRPAIVASCGGITRIYDCASGAVLDELVSPADEPAGRVLCLLALPDGRLASGGEDGVVRIWSFGAAPETGAGLEGSGLGLSPAGAAEDVSLQLSSSAFEREQARLLQAPVLRHVCEHALVSEEGAAGSSAADRVVTAMCLLQDGRLVTGTADGRILVWWLPAPQLHQHTSSAGRGLAGAVLASGTGPRRLDGRPTVLLGHAGPVQALAGVSSGKLLSGGADGHIRLWSVPRAASAGACLVTVARHSGPVTSLHVLAADVATAGSSAGAAGGEVPMAMLTLRFMSAGGPRSDGEEAGAVAVPGQAARGDRVLGWRCALLAPQQTLGWEGAGGPSPASSPSQRKLTASFAGGVLTVRAGREPGEASARSGHGGPGTPGFTRGRQQPPSASPSSAAGPSAAGAPSALPPPPRSAPLPSAAEAPSRGSSRPNSRSRGGQLAAPGPSAPLDATAPLMPWQQPGTTAAAGDAGAASRVKSDVRGSGWPTDATSSSARSAGDAALFSRHHSHPSPGGFGAGAAAPPEQPTRYGADSFAGTALESAAPANGGFFWGGDATSGVLQQTGASRWEGDADGWQREGEQQEQECPEAASAVPGAGLGAQQQLRSFYLKRRGPSDPEPAGPLPSLRPAPDAFSLASRYPSHRSELVTAGPGAGLFLARQVAVASPGGASVGGASSSSGSAAAAALSRLGVRAQHPLAAGSGAPSPAPQPAHRATTALIFSPSLRGAATPMHSAAGLQQQQQQETGAAGGGRVLPLAAPSALSPSSAGASNSTVTLMVISEAGGAGGAGGFYDGAALRARRAVGSEESFGVASGADAAGAGQSRASGAGGAARLALPHDSPRVPSLASGADARLSVLLRRSAAAQVSGAPLPPVPAITSPLLVGDAGAGGVQSAAMAAAVAAAEGRQGASARPQRFLPSAASASRYDFAYPALPEEAPTPQQVEEAQAAMARTWAAEAAADCFGAITVVATQHSDRGSGGAPAAPSADATVTSPGASRLAAAAATARVRLGGAASPQRGSPRSDTPTPAAAAEEAALEKRHCGSASAAPSAPAAGAAVLYLSRGAAGSAEVSALSGRTLVAPTPEAQSAIAALAGAAEGSRRQALFRAAEAVRRSGPPAAAGSSLRIGGKAYVFGAEVSAAALTASQAASAAAASSFFEGPCGAQAERAVATSSVGPDDRSLSDRVNGEASPRWAGDDLEAHGTAGRVFSPRPQEVRGAAVNRGSEDDAESGGLDRGGASGGGGAGAVPLPFPSRVALLDAERRDRGGVQTTVFNFRDARSGRAAQQAERLLGGEGAGVRDLSRHPAEFTHTDPRYAPRVFAAPLPDATTAIVAEVRQ